MNLQGEPTKKIKVPFWIFIPMRLLSLVFLIPLVFIAFQFGVFKGMFLICYNQLVYGGEYICYEKNYNIKASFEKIEQLIKESENGR